MKCVAFTPFCLNNHSKMPHFIFFQYYVLYNHPYISSSGMVDIPHCLLLIAVLRCVKCSTVKKMKCNIHYDCFATEMIIVVKRSERHKLHFFQVSFSNDIDFTKQLVGTISVLSTWRSENCTDTAACMYMCACGEILFFIQCFAFPNYFWIVLVMR